MENKMNFSFANKTDDFDNHIDNSIRGYSDLCDDVKELSRMIVDSGTNVVDIGSSTGKMIKEIYNFNKIIKTDVNYYAVEIEDKFNNYYRDFNHLDNFHYYNKDIFECNFKNCSFVYSIFTLQFLPQHKRIELLSSICNWLVKGGFFVFSEKIDMQSPFNEFFQNLLFERKRFFFKDNEILDKEYCLRYLMRRFTICENIKMCKNSGFSKVETFWQNHRFVGFVCKK